MCASCSRIFTRTLHLRRRRVTRGLQRVMWGAAAVVAATLAGAAGWFFVGARAPAPAQPVRVTPLVTYPGVKDFPAISRDGSVVAFSWRKPGTNNFDLYVMQVDGGPPVQRTTSPADDYFASMSPDGRTIAFVRGTAFGANDIMAIPTLGGPEQRIASWGGAFFGPAWTADGRHLIVNDRATPGEPLSLFAVSLDTGERRPFTDAARRFQGDRGCRGGVFVGPPTAARLSSGRQPVRRPLHPAAVGRRRPGRLTVPADETTLLGERARLFARRRERAVLRRAGTRAGALARADPLPGHDRA